MSQEILHKLDELRAGQDSLHERLGSLENGLREMREQDLVALLAAIQGVSSTVNGNSARIARLSQLVERLHNDGDLGPQAATG